MNHFNDNGLNDVENGLKQQHPQINESVAVTDTPSFFHEIVPSTSVLNKSKKIKSKKFNSRTDQ